MRKVEEEFLSTNPFSNLFSEFIINEPAHKHLLNLSKSNGISHSYQLDQSIPLKCCWVTFFIQLLIEHSVNKQCRP